MNGVDLAGSASEEIDAIIRKSGDWRGETLSRLRGIVLSAGPAVVEEVKWKKPSKPEGVPVWSLDGIVCIGETLKNAVRLTFPKGAKMKDPKKLFNARMDSSSIRAIDFREGEKIPEDALRASTLTISLVDRHRRGHRWRSPSQAGRAGQSGRGTAKRRRGTALGRSPALGGSAVVSRFLRRPHVLTEPDLEVVLLAVAELDQPRDHVFCLVDAVVLEHSSARGRRSPVDHNLLDIGPTESPVGLRLDVGLVGFGASWRYPRRM